MSAQKVQGISGGGVRGTRENRGGLKSSWDAHREETLKMTQFITITATKERERERNEGKRCKREQDYVLQYISKTRVSV